jgi:hypothetical protein
MYLIDYYGFTYIGNKMTCKGICQRHKASRPKTGKRYLIGQKRCQGCEIFIDWQGIWCPCCGYRLRVNPRHSKFKLMLRTIKNKKN